VTARHLYVHVPFCARRCTYCDFSIAVRKATPVREYLGALEREVRRSDRVAAPATLYLGGGTPSRLGGDGIAQVARLCGVTGDVAEFTLEANPDDVTREAARAWASAGVNRLSLGAQSFDDQVLRWMHRTHDAAAIAPAVRIARAAGIATVSLDFIFALPDALGRDVRGDLERTIACEPDHISLYGLTVEPGTPLARQVARGACAAAPDERYEAEYLLAHELLREAGFTFYEVSNAARGGREAVHNRAYWQLRPYLGFGPSAHSFDGVTRWWNEAAYARWVRRLATGASPIAGRETLAEPQRRLEQLYLGLRTSEGIEVPDPCPPLLAAAMAKWVGAGWAVLSRPTADAAAEPLRPLRPPRLCLTVLGWLRLDELVASV
jgi:oxygen-independent coproporphyrinogen-3 oxidase